MDREEAIRNSLEPKLDEEMKDLISQKNKLKDETAKLQETLLSLQQRNKEIVDQMEKESASFSMRLQAQCDNFENTQEECKQLVEEAKSKIDEDFQKARAVLISNKKIYNYKIFSLNEKNEVNENRKQLLAQKEKLRQEYEIISREMDKKREQNFTEIYNKRDAFKNAAKLEIEAEIEKAKREIDIEREQTLAEAKEQCKKLDERVHEEQKEVVKQRDQYTKLLEESNNLEMQLMEAKLVTQLTTPEKNKQIIQNLIIEKDNLEDLRMKAKTKPEAEGRRKYTQHLNMMKKKKNQLNAIKKLNQIKLTEMQKLRALAMIVIEQRNTLMSFMNETITLLRKEIASYVNQRGFNFRTSELILCHLADDEEQYQRMFPDDDGTVKDISEQLKLFEVLYSRFTGIAQPRKTEE